MNPMTRYSHDKAIWTHSTAESGLILLIVVLLKTLSDEIAVPFRIFIGKRTPRDNPVTISKYTIR